jgi:hypothetical protein
MTLTQTQEGPHRRARAGVMAARVGQFTGALPVTGGVAAPAPRHLAGAWAGYTGGPYAPDQQHHHRVRRRP